MPVTYRKKNHGEIHEVMQAAMQKYCPILIALGVRVDTIAAANVDEKNGATLQAVKLGGYPCHATIKVNNLKARAQGMGDALITVDEGSWDELTDDERVALMHHELFHLEPVKLNKEKNGCDTDDLSRPKLTCRLHDWQHGGFRHIAEVHRGNAIEVLNAQKIARQFGDCLSPVEAPAK